jgi:class 3 adenylate cyclase/tetratricopeptide (TPR) repeat protein
MRCAACGHDNPERAKFCLECGVRFAATCAQCGTELPTGAKFCLECGTRVGVAAHAAAAPDRAAAPPAAPERAGQPASYTPKHLAQKILNTRSALEGERRQVTVLFADMAGFTALAERMDPEEVHRIMDRCFELITAEVHRFEGTVNQYTGDGVMALFGAPIAHEDAPRRAGHAALGIQRALRDLSDELERAGGPALRMRIGLNTGPVVVGRIGDDLRMDYTAVGDTTNLAARMQQAARPGSVVVTDATHRTLSGFFETLDLGLLAVKGHAAVHAFEVLRPRGRRSRFEAVVERGLTPLIGRTRELETLVSLFAQMEAGHGQVVFITGEAGLGKSRLLLEFRRQLAQERREVTWLEGQCVSFGQPVPFLPIIDQLRENFRIEELDGEPEIIAKIEHGMRRMGGLEAHIPYIRYLLSVDPGDPTVVGLDALVRRRKVFEAVGALSLRGASLRPLILVFEDLHWADPGTEEYLTALMDSVAGVRLILILTYRVGYRPPFGSRSFHTTLTLRTLTAKEAVAMAGRVLGTEHFPDELAVALMDKAEGVPLFIEEVTKTLLDLGVLRRENGGYRMVKGIEEVSVPDTIQGIIMARLDRLGEDGKRTVQLASVIGRQFLARLLARVAGLSERLEGLLGELKSLEIIYELGLLPEPAYIFKHAVIQDVAYNSLLRERRKELHRAVGLAIEELYADRLTDHYEELAHHFSLGEEWGKAFEYLVRSADRARDAYANLPALDLYARALAAGPRCAPAIASGRLLRLYQSRGLICRLLSRIPDAIAENEKMLALAREAGDRVVEGEALLDLALSHWLGLSSEMLPYTRRYATEALAIGRETGDQRIIAKSLCYLGLVDQVDGELTSSDVKLQESLRIAEAGRFADVIVQSQCWLGAHANWRGEFARAVELSRVAVLKAIETHDGFQEIFSLAFQCLGHLGLGEYREGLAVIAEGLAKARERQNIFIQGRLTNTLGWFYEEVGDFRRARELDEEAVALGRAGKNPNVEISSLINLGYDLLRAGEADKGLALLGDTLERVEKHAFGAHRWRWGNHLAAYLAEGCLLVGDLDRARQYAESCIAQARRTGSRKYIAKGQAALGEIALATGRRAEAEVTLREALGGAQAIRYPVLTWQAAHLLGRALAPSAGERGVPAARVEEAGAMLQLATDTIASIAESLPEAGHRASLAAWDRVQAVHADLDRLRRL